MCTVNNFIGVSDSDMIENAMRSCKNGVLIIPPRKSETEPQRDYWLIDRAIVIPENTTVILKNCKIKLSDKCRDNFFRSANCGLGINEPRPISNIHIKGEGLCVLEGADHPRSTGDGSKFISCPCPKHPEDLCRLADWIPQDRKESGKLDFWDEHSHSYGTDANEDGQSHRGDWRNVGILFANVKHFSVENLKMVNYHGWGVSLEACSFGRVEKMDFDACMARDIDGMLHNSENQDGIDLRNGCNNIFISDITGNTGDDIIALTAMAHSDYIPGGSYNTMHVMHNDWTKRDRNIHDIIIRNVAGYSKGGLCYHVRLLACDTKIWNVVIDGVVDTSPDGFRAGGVILIGSEDEDYGVNLADSISRVTVSNVICNSNYAILVPGYIKDSVISNVINYNPSCPVIHISKENGFENVTTSALTTVGKELITKGTSKTVVTLAP